MHSHSLNAVMATLLDTSASEFTVTNLEMIKASQVIALVRCLLSSRAACSTVRRLEHLDAMHCNLGGLYRHAISLIRATPRAGHCGSWLL